MATDAHLDDIFDLLRDSYSKAASWPTGATIDVWREEFRDVAPDALMEGVRAAMRASPKYAPNPAAVREQLDRTGSGGGETVRPCPDCRLSPGWREMACHYRDERVGHQVVVRLAACECRRGKQVQAATWRQLDEHWRRLLGARLVAIHRTHRDAPVLTEAERETPETLARLAEMRRARPPLDARIAARQVVAEHRQDDHRARRFDFARRAAGDVDEEPEFAGFGGDGVPA